MSVVRDISSAAREPAPALGDKFVVRKLTCSYGEGRVLTDVDLTVPAKRVTALIGASGCGKSTFLRVLNRTEGRDTLHITGEVLLDGADLLAPDVDVLALRRRVGMVFQAPRVLPRTVFENLTWALRLEGLRDPRALEARVESALAGTDLWSELRELLRAPAASLSKGIQQRVCIARALAVQPEVLLLDDPTHHLDPIAIGRIEELLSDLRERITVVIVTTHPQQAARVSQHVAFFDGGRLVEAAETRRIFTRPREPRTQDYLTGRFG